MNLTILGPLIIATGILGSLLFFLCLLIIGIKCNRKNKENYKEIIEDWIIQTEEFVFTVFSIITVVFFAPAVIEFSKNYILIEESYKIILEILVAIIIVCLLNFVFNQTTYNRKIDDKIKAEVRLTATLFAFIWLMFFDVNNNPMFYLGLILSRLLFFDTTILQLRESFSSVIKKLDTIIYNLIVLLVMVWLLKENGYMLENSLAYLLGIQSAIVLVLHISRKEYIVDGVNEMILKWNEDTF